RLHLEAHGRMRKWTTGVAALVILGAELASAPSHAQPPRRASTGGTGISARFAESLYHRVIALREADGCHVERLDTRNSRLLVGIQAPSGAQHEVEVKAARSGSGGQRRAGDWALTVPAEIDRDCASTEAAIEAILTEESLPRPSFGGDLSL